MRKFNISPRRFSALALPFSSPFVQARAGTLERADTVSFKSNPRGVDGAQPLTSRDYAGAAIRLSRTYW